MANISRRGLLGATAVAGIAGGLAACGKSDDGPATPQNTAATSYELSMTANSIVGGKSSANAEWLSNWVIPHFTDDQKAKGVTATVKFIPNGVDDSQYKSKESLDLKTGSGADLVSLDGIWVGEFAQAGYIQPLDKTVGASWNDWDGWKQISKAVQGNVSFEDKVYGIPDGTDGRILYFNKKIFAQAGLPADWQPKSWDEIISACATLAKLPGIIPIQINAGTAMGEATTMQGFLPLLAGTGAQIYDNGKWTGNTQQFRDVLTFYKKLVDAGYENKDLQLATKGRDQSFDDFAAGKIAILGEGDYFWRSVIEPKQGSSKMADRDTAVGWCMIPSQNPGKGVRGQDFVSCSGGSGWFINPKTKYPTQAWQLLTFMESADSIKAQLNGTARVTARDDVNKEVLSGDPLLSFISTKVLPLTTYRPGFAEYNDVSLAVQQATADIVSGKSVDDAAKAYQAAVAKVVGNDKVASN